MDLEDIARKVKCGINTLQTHDGKKQKIKSRCWESFRDIIDDCGNKLYGVACCSRCHSCIIFKKKEGGKVVDFGTKNMMDHASNCGSSDALAKKQTSLTPFVHRQRKTLIPHSEQVKVRENEALFIGGCHLAFNVVDSGHFRRLCQNLIDLGAKYGHVDVGDVLVGRKSVRDDIVKMAQQVKNIITDKLKTPVAEGTVAFTTDL